MGELVELRALVIHTGRTSLHVAIDIYARDPKLSELKLLNVEAEELEKRNEEIKSRFVEFFGA